MGEFTSTRSPPTTRWMRGVDQITVVRLAVEMDEYRGRTHADKDWLLQGKGAEIGNKEIRNLYNKPTL